MSFSDLRKLNPSDIKKAKKLHPSGMKKKASFEKFNLYFRRFLNILFTSAEALVLLSIYIVVIKYCFYTITESDDYRKVYELIKFFKENYGGAILLFLLIFSRTCLNMLYSVKIFKAKDYEVQLNQQKTMWDIL